jgi:ribosomal protein L40E
MGIVLSAFRHFMKLICSKCNSDKIVLRGETKAEDTINGLGHLHLECMKCGNQFNQWVADKEKVKKEFGESYELYK